VPSWSFEIRQTREFFMPSPPFILGPTQIPSDLADLISAFDAAKRVQDEAQAVLDEAKERADALNAQIKAAVTATWTHPQFTPGTAETEQVPFERYELDVPGLERPFVLRWQVTHRVDTKRLKAELPEVHAAYAPGVGGWVLERKRGK
jgi:hypothetical protein